MLKKIISIYIRKQWNKDNIEMLCLYAYPRDESYHKIFGLWLFLHLKKSYYSAFFYDYTYIRIEDKKVTKS